MGDRVPLRSSKPSEATVYGLSAVIYLGLTDEKALIYKSKCCCRVNFRSAFIQHLRNVLMNSDYCADIQILLLKDVYYPDIFSDILRIVTDTMIRVKTDILEISAMIPIHYKENN